MEQKNLKMVRIEKGYSVIELADLVGVYPSVYYKWEPCSITGKCKTSCQSTRLLC